MAVHVDPTAVVDPHAVLDDNVHIGPYCVIGPEAFIGSGTKFHNHVTVMGHTRIGHDNVFYPNAVIGSEPQDLTYRGEPTWTVIGDRNTFREGCTVHRATTKEHGITHVGSDNYFMSGVHIAHDCQIGNKIIIANMTQISGHAHVMDHAVISGMVGIHQWVTIGRFAFIGAMARIRTDCVPFMFHEGFPAEVMKVNIVGLRRNGFSRDEIRGLCEAHRILFRRGMVYELAKEEIQRTLSPSRGLVELVSFMENTRLGLKGRGREGRKAA
ncbi:acyl-ACP--UDP-N-acetylglucosamine O-acyltransferase [bacterium]|jgi:UDP-N-acetylglucosamine acyltransferase|nr:acyl-ACP--UDP-N-acetylglucosamine O-acyltransferase [bacterium]